MIYSQRISWDTDDIVRGLVLTKLFFFVLSNGDFEREKNSSYDILWNFEIDHMP